MLLPKINQIRVLSRPRHGPRPWRTGGQVRFEADGPERSRPWGASTHPRYWRTGGAVARSASRLKARKKGRSRVTPMGRESAAPSTSLRAGSSPGPARAVAEPGSSHCSAWWRSRAAAASAGSGACRRGEVWAHCGAQRQRRCLLDRVHHRDRKTIKGKIREK